MAFKLLIEVTEEGALDVSHDGQIEPIVLLGALRTLEHNVLTTMDAMAAQGLMEAVEAAPKTVGAATEERPAPPMSVVAAAVHASMTPSAAPVWNGLRSTSFAVSPGAYEA